MGNEKKGQKRNEEKRGKEKGEEEKKKRKDDVDFINNFLRIYQDLIYS